MLRQHINFSHLISISVTLDIDAFLFLFEQARPKVSKVENIVIHVILSEPRYVINFVICKLAVRKADKRSFQEPRLLGFFSSFSSFSPIFRPFSQFCFHLRFKKKIILRFYDMYRVFRINLHHFEDLGGQLTTSFRL